MVYRGITFLQTGCNLTYEVPLTLQLRRRCPGLGRRRTVLGSRVQGCEGNREVSGVLQRLLG